MLVLGLLLVLAAVAGVLSGVVGTGSSLVLLPALLWAYGPRVAVPVMGIAAVLGNIGRAVAWWRRIAWRPTLAYAIPGVPAAVLGARTLLAIPERVADAAIAVFFVAMIVARRRGVVARWRFRLWHMAVAGAVVGFLTGLLFSTGPLSVPIFTAYGLGGGSFLGSEAASSLLLYAGKLATFGVADALTGAVIVRGLTIGAALMIGSVVARRIVERIGGHTHEILIDIVLAIGAATMVLAILN
ncbi:sulfite exporter TauE/SafE family protein [Paractinoplanes lichenicola]|uniref:Probable membrane transporter protein n=1 Tax=Paractinoplanes lichenicola TaxID=2802976 RepID=A0ABS1VMJ8_9ACTN|nr:sulfite exporter TauE/SafE family protein [Actinoplanes lichenicola]MBL7255874.1 sulfite exporter TauE/SafE family protein [Actinoplanes lichenicola]